MFAWYRPYNCNGAITAAVVAVASSLVAAFPVHNVLLGTGHTAPVVVFGVLLLVASVSLFGTILSDPGIIPRRPPLRPGECKPNRVQDVLVAGQLTRLRWCETCCIFRPPRSAHCWIVDACIENYDHYCPFLGNAIGKGNYRFYLAFIASTSLLTLFSIAVCVVDMALVVQRGRPRSPTDSAPTWTIIFTDAPVTLALTVFLFLAMCFVVGLTVFHTYLIALGMSTNERLRDAFPDGNPYSKGVLRNLTSICCAWPRRGRRRHRRMVPSETAAVASANGSRQSADDNGDSLVLEVRHTIHGQV
ncbi:Palmitoyltransferase [Plasmodiophora brassicae]